MRLNYIITLFLSLAACMILNEIPARAQENGQVRLYGTISSETDRKPVELCTVLVMEARKKTYTDSNGKYQVELPGPGEYTVVIRSAQFRMLSEKVRISKTVQKDFYLHPVTVSGQGITVTGERDIQKVARYTMTQKNLKEVPGSFGDSVSALASLPGVIRTGGLFGPLVIRGADPQYNSYLIDDIPIFNPMHFGGIHSVINNNLMKEIDLYASAFPAQYGSATAAVININTIDDVKEFSGYTDIGLISASGLIQSPILRDSLGGLHFDSPSEALSGNTGEYTNAGYSIASGRFGYLSVFIPLIYRAFSGEKLTSIPEYWDYQAKMKYFFTKKHSLTLLMMGSSDYFKFIDKDADVSDSEDPVLNGASMRMKADWTAHSQGLYYTWQPADLVSNRLMAYSALIGYYSYLAIDGPDVANWLKDIRIDSKPYIMGFKDRFRIEPFRDHVQLTAGADYTLYWFTARGKTIMNTTAVVGDPDMGNDDLFKVIPLDEDTKNHLVGGHLQGKFTAGGFSMVPGVRTDYLSRTNKATIDPRINLSYEFPTETTLSVAGGRYSYFVQVNPFLFNSFPEVAGEGSYIKPERSIHRVAGIEQKIGPVSAKVEGFYNTSYDMAQSYFHYGPAGDERLCMSTGKSRAYGFECMLKRDLREDEDGLYGWVSYTYTRSRYKSGLPTTAGVYGDARNAIGDPYGGRWINFSYEQVHGAKLVGGYTFKSRRFEGRHTISGRFQLNTSLPYSPITGSLHDEDYENSTGKPRYVPLYGFPNSSRFETQHQLDLRYSYRTDYSWGYVSWYIEVINVYGPWYHPSVAESWDYRYAYSTSNPKIERQSGLSIMPNFGVEIKF